MEYQKVLVRPLITEKTTILQEAGKYVFEVAKKANKVSVKEAVARTFGVTVLDVNICRTRGKTKRFGPKPHITPDTKKAIVTLKPGEKIQLVEGI